MSGSPWSAAVHENRVPSTGRGHPAPEPIPTPSSIPAPRIRPCLRADEESVYAICLRTGDAGQDATPLYSDPRALGLICLGAYLRIEPRLALVLEDDLGICGFIVGALESDQLYEFLLQSWLPGLRARCPAPAGNPAAWTPTEKLYHQCHHPFVHYPPSFHDFPSHLHLGLLPRAQGRGHGTALLRRLLNDLRRLNSTGVHLGVEHRNPRAERFYRKLGFSEIGRLGAGEQQNLYLGLSLSNGQNLLSHR